MPAPPARPPRRRGYHLAALACLLPMVALAFYSHPALDDFAFGELLRHGSIGAYVANVYRHSSGRYAAALSTVVIQAFGRQPALYPWLVLAGLLALVVALYAAAWAAAPAGSRLGGPIGSVLVVVCLLGLPKPADGIYWLTGEVAYLYPVALAALLLALLAWLAARPAAPGQAAAWAVAAALAAFVPGYSELTAVLLPLVAAGCWLALPPPRRARAGWVAVTAAAVAGSVATLATPAHFGHWRPAGQPLWVLTTAARAAAHAGYAALNWLGSGMLGLWLLLAVPLSGAYARAAGGRGLVQRLTRPLGLWPALTAVGLWAGFFFYLLAAHDAPVPRVLNLLYWYFVAGLVLSAHAAFRRLPGCYRARLLARPARLALGAALALALLCDHNPRLQPGRGRLGPVPQAYRDWLSGDAARYHWQQLARVARVRATAPGTAPLRLEPLQVLPPTLFYADLAPVPSAWPNVAYAAFYHGPPVYVAPAR